MCVCFKDFVIDSPVLLLVICWFVSHCWWVIVRIQSVGSQVSSRKMNNDKASKLAPITFLVLCSLNNGSDQPAVAMEMLRFSFHPSFLSCWCSVALLDGHCWESISC